MIALVTTVIETTIGGVMIEMTVIGTLGTMIVIGVIVTIAIGTTGITIDRETAHPNAAGPVSAVRARRVGWHRCRVASSTSLPVVVPAAIASSLTIPLIETRSGTISRALASPSVAANGLLAPHRGIRVGTPSGHVTIGTSGRESMIRAIIAPIAALIGMRDMTRVVEIRMMQTRSKHSALIEITLVIQGDQNALRCDCTFPF